MLKIILLVVGWFVIIDFVLRDETQ